MFKLTIRTPEEQIYAKEAYSVYMTTEGGDIQIFENHASITASILFSPIVVAVTENEEEVFLARNGMFLFDNDKNEAVMLVSFCEKKSETSYKTIEEYSKFIKKQLEEGKDLSDLQIKYLKNELVSVEHVDESFNKA